MSTQQKKKSSYYPKWLSSVDQTLQSFQKRIVQFNVMHNKVKQGLKQFDRRRADDNDIWQSNNVVTYQKQHSKQSLLNSLHPYIWLKIIQYTSLNVISTAYRLVILAKSFDSKKRGIIQKVIQKYLGTIYVILSYKTKLIKKQHYDQTIKNHFKHYHYFKKAIIYYKQTQCPKTIKIKSAQNQIAEAMQFMFQMIHLVKINRNKQWILFKFIERFLIANSGNTIITGIFILVRLSQVDSPFTKSLAFNNLVSLCGLSQFFRCKIKIFKSISSFIKQPMLQRRDRLRLVFNSEIMNEFKDSPCIFPLHQSNFMISKKLQSLKEQMKFKKVNKVLLVIIYNRLNPQQSFYLPQPPHKLSQSQIKIQQHSTIKYNLQQRTYNTISNINNDNIITNGYIQKQWEQQNVYIMLGESKQSIYYTMVLVT